MLFFSKQFTGRCCHIAQLYKLLWKSKTWVTSCELQVQRYKFWEIHELLVQIHELWNPWVMSSNTRVRKVKVQVAILKAQVVRLKVQVRRLKGRAGRFKAQVKAIKPRVK